MTGPSVQPLSGLQLTARDIRFQRVAGLGGADVAVVELAGGTVGGRDAKGAKLELPAAELNRRLADQSKGAIRALRAVVVRADDRWRVSLLASAAEQGRLAAGAAEPAWDQLASTGQQAAPALPRPRRRSATWWTRPARASRPPWSCSRRPSGGSWPPTGRCWTARAGCPGWAVQVEGLQLRTEEVADGVARVRATAGRLAGGTPRESLNLEEATAKGQARTWSPSARTGRGIHLWCSP